ncbi:hypothetical protein [Weissella bombi]|uniref:Uncharacterized protein n=1 Tax=Weissella bombi TaxID=1505725 RepID=A0A1C4C199_9LACO|nr:hypothetical protein [Weissella bombi]SCC12899.1 hypothetical protein GA0061074_11921 [Weissella bombi]
MAQINIGQDTALFIHAVLTDSNTKNNPELITAVTGLLDRSVELGLFPSFNEINILMDEHKI